MTVVTSIAGMFNTINNRGHSLTCYNISPSVTTCHQESPPVTNSHHLSPTVTTCQNSLKEWLVTPCFEVIRLNIPMDIPRPELRLICHHSPSVTTCHNLLKVWLMTTNFNDLSQNRPMDIPGPEL